MAHVGTLPIWAMFLIGSVVLAFGLGLLNPYVSKATLLKLEQVDKEDWSKPRPTVMIKERMSPSLVVILILLALLAAFLTFLAQCLMPLSREIDMGMIGGIIVVGLSLIGTDIMFLLDMIVYVTGLEITSHKLKRHYERFYGAKIEREP